MTNILTLKEKLTFEIENALKAAQADGSLPQVPIPAIVLEHPQRQEHGDIATSLPLKCTRAMAKKPADIASEITRYLPPMPEISKVQVALPGFINFTLSTSWLSAQIKRLSPTPIVVQKLTWVKVRKSRLSLSA